MRAMVSFGRRLAPAAMVMVCMRVGAAQTVDLYTAPGYQTVGNSVTAVNLRGTGEGWLQLIDVGAVPDMRKIDKYDSGTWHTSWLGRADWSNADGGKRCNVDVWGGYLDVYLLVGSATVHDGGTLKVGPVFPYITMLGTASITVEAGGIWDRGDAAGVPASISAHGTAVPYNRVTFAPGSTFRISLNQTAATNTWASSASVAGTLQIVDHSSGVLPSGKSFLFLGADSATGNFDRVIDDSPTTDFTLSKVENGTGGADYYIVARTLWLMHEVPSRVLLSQSQSFSRTLAAVGREQLERTSGAATALASPSPMSSATQTHPLMLSQTFSDAPATAPAAGRVDGKLNVIGAYLGQAADVDGSPSRLGCETSSNGLLLGVDGRLGDSSFAGVAFSYASTDVDIDRDRGSVSADSYRVGPYLGMQHERWQLDGSATAGFHQIDSTRLASDSVLAQQAQSDHDAFDATVYGALSRAFALDAFSISPLASLQYTYLREESFTETGPSASNLSVDPQSMHSLLSVLGAKVSTETSVAGVTVRPELFGGWAYESLDSGETIDATFISSPTESLSVRKSSPDRSRWLLGAGADVVITRTLSTYARYTAELSNSADTHSFSGGLSWRF